MQHVGVVAIPGTGSPSPFTRTPRDDAPPYDPTLWEGRDFSFLTTYRETMQVNQRAAAVRSMEQEFLSSGMRGAATELSSENQMGAKKNGLTDAAVQHDLAALHMLPETSVPLSFWGRVKGFLFGNRPKPVLRTNLQNVPSDDLVLQMYAALRSGESEVAAAAAQELARRKTVLFDHALRTDAELNAAVPGSGASGSGAKAWGERRVHDWRNGNGNTDTQQLRGPHLPGTAAAFDARHVDVASRAGPRPVAWQTRVPAAHLSAESRVFHDGASPPNRARDVAASRGHTAGFADRRREKFSRSLSPPDEGQRTSRPRKTVHFFE